MDKNIEHYFCTAASCPMCRIHKCREAQDAANECFMEYRASHCTTHFSADVADDLKTPSITSIQPPLLSVKLVAQRIKPISTFLTTGLDNKGCEQPSKRM